jgi:hypothetical protein
MEYQQVSVRNRFPVRLHANVSGYDTALLPRRHIGRHVGVSIPRRPLTVSRDITTAEIVKRLDVTTLAVNKWREGSNQRAPLPYETTHVGKANRVFIKECDLITWLGAHRPDLLEIWRG